MLKMDKNCEEISSNEQNSNSYIKCLICASPEVVKDDESTLIEQIQLFEQLIEQKVSDEFFKV